MRFKNQSIFFYLISAAALLVSSAMLVSFAPEGSHNFMKGLGVPFSRKLTIIPLLLVGFTLSFKPMHMQALLVSTFFTAMVFSLSISLAPFSPIFFRTIILLCICVYLALQAKAGQQALPAMYAAIGYLYGMSHHITVAGSASGLCFVLGFVFSYILILGAALSLSLTFSDSLRRALADKYQTMQAGILAFYRINFPKY